MSHGLDFLKLNVGWRRAAAWSLLVLTCATIGCGGEALNRAAVAGKVVVDGKPLRSGRILFLPEAAGGGPAVSAVIRHGEYQIPIEKGPVVGPQRVEVEIDRQLGFEIDDEAEFAKRNSGRPHPGAGPPSFRVPTNLTTNITEGSNVYDVSLPPLRE